MPEAGSQDTPELSGRGRAEAELSRLIPREFPGNPEMLRDKQVGDTIAVGEAPRVGTFQILKISEKFGQVGITLKLLPDEKSEKSDEVNPNLNAVYVARLDVKKAA